MLHPVPPVPELRSKVAKRIERWRVGPGKRPMAVFITAVVASAFIQTIGWMYFLNVFCMSGYLQTCTRRLDWSTWFLATMLFYVNAWSLASWITDVSEKRRLKRLKPSVEQRLAALPADQLKRRESVAMELRERALDREMDQPRAYFQAKILGWFRNFFIVGSVVPLFALTGLFDELVSIGAIVAIVSVQAYVLLKLTKYVRRMRRISRELAAQWEKDLADLERDVVVAAPLGPERVTFRPWAPKRARAPEGG